MPAFGRIWTKEEVEYLSSAWQEGIGEKAIAEHLGRTIRSIKGKIQNLRNKKDQSGFVKRKEYTKYSDETRAMIVELARQGLSYWEISKRTGVHNGAARHIALADERRRKQEEQRQIEEERRSEIIAHIRKVYVPEPPKCFVPRKPVAVPKVIVRTRRVDVTGALMGDPGAPSLRVMRNERSKCGM